MQKLLPKATVILLLFLGQIASPSYAQNLNPTAIAEEVKGLKLRSIGPALMGGRIADIAVSPKHGSTW